MNIPHIPKALFGHRVLVLLDPIKSELQLPDQRQYDPTIGIVKLVGDGLNSMQVRIIPITVAKDDRILMAEVGFEPISIEGQAGTFRLCHGDDILGVL